MKTETMPTEPGAVGSTDLLGVSRSINDQRMEPATIGVPSLCNGCPELCEGCGEPKLYRGREATSFVACRKCSRKLKWMNDARTGPDAMMWENRMAVVLMWMREASSPNAPVSSSTPE